MDCGVCNHKEHDANKCKQCNCGQSEIRQFTGRPKIYREIEYDAYLLNIYSAMKRGALQQTRSYKTCQ